MKERKIAARVRRLAAQYPVVTLVKESIMYVRSIVASVIMVCGVTAFGETYYLNTSAAAAKSGCSPTNALWWSTAAGVTLGTQASDPVPPEHDYVVGGSKQFKMDAKVKSFPCASLTFGVASGYEAGRGIFNNYANKTQLSLGSHVIMHAGTFRAMTGSSSRHQYSAAKTTVTAPEGAPFQFLFRYPNQAWTVDSPMESAAGTELRCGESLDSTSETSARYCNFYFTNDWSAYRGTLTVTSRFERVSADDFGVRANFAELEMPGKMVLSSDVIFTAVKALPLTVGGFTLGDNCALELDCEKVGEGWTNASITVTDSFTMKGDAVVTLRDWEPVYDGVTSNEIVILTVPAASVLDASRFTVELTNHVQAIPHELMVVEDAAAGVKRLVMRFEPAVRQIASDVTTCNKAKDGVSYANSCTNALNWSDHRLPHSGAHYLVVENDNGRMWLRTPQDTDGKDDTAIDYTFPGESLIIGEDCGMTVFGRHFRTKKIVLLEGGDIQNGQQHRPDIHADICAPAGDVNISAYNGNAMVLDGELTGEARIHLGSVGGTTSAPTGSEYFDHVNTNFFGKVEVYMRSVNVKNAKSTVYHSLKVGDERNLGGALAAFDPCAFSVHGPWTHLIAAADVTFTTNYNRGVYFYDRPVIDTGNYKMKFTTGVGVWGNVEKIGTGTLELGGTLAFEDGTATVPLEGSNTLQVTQGTLAISAAGAADGLALSFANDTALVLKVDFDDAGFLASGIRNVKAETPFALSGSLTKLPLTVDAAGRMPQRSCMVGLVTVTNAAASSVRAIMPTSIPKICQGFRQSAVQEIADTDNDTVTYAVKIVPAGTKVVVR